MAKMSLTYHRYIFYVLNVNNNMRNVILIVFKMFDERIKFFYCEENYSTVDT